MKKTFVLSDQTVNQYGFVVLTAGIKLDRFLSNPVMLGMHKTGLTDVIGNWDNTRAEGLKLLADTNFDLDDESVKPIARKVEKGFIKGASVWVDFEMEDVKLNVAGYEGIPVVTKSELMEASIVSIPNNKNAIKLSANGKLLEDNSLALKLSAVNDNPNIEIQTMKKILLFASALGVALSADASEDHLLEAVKTVASERDALKAELADLKAKLAAEHDTKVTALIDGAITGKKLSADKKEHFTKLAKLDFESTKAIIEGLVPQKSISEQLNAGGGKGEEKGPFDGKGLKELMKDTEGSKYLAKLRGGNADEKAIYKKLWEAAHPGGVFNG